MTAHPLAMRVSRVGLIPAHKDPSRSARQSTMGSSITVLLFVSDSNSAVTVMMWFRRKGFRGRAELFVGNGIACPGSRAPAASATGPHHASSPTAWSASRTVTSRPAPPMTRVFVDGSTPNPLAISSNRVFSSRVRQRYVPTYQPPPPEIP
jgi:hypothetical protein